MSSSRGKHALITAIRWNRWPAAGICLGLALLGGGCSSGDDEPTSAVSESDADSDSESDGDADSAAGHDLCRLLSVADGERLTQRTGLVVTPDEEACKYDDPINGGMDPTGVVNISVTDWRTCASGMGGASDVREIPGLAKPACFSPGLLLSVTVEDGSDNYYVYLQPTNNGSDNGAAIALETAKLVIANLG